MARSYNGSTDFHSVAAVGVAAAPLTLACWFNPNGVAVNETLMTLGRASGNGYFRLSFQGAVANDPVVATATNTSNSAASSSVNTTQAAGAWGHAAGVYASTTSRTAYWNGTAAAANATSIAAGTLANTTIGCFNTIGAQSLFFAGSIAHAAIWNVALAQDDITALAQGCSPLLIRPDALVAYYPLYGRGTGAEDWTGGTGSLTATGSPGVVDEPRIVYGRAARLILPHAATAGASTGDLSQSLAALSLSSAGTLALQGSLAKTLGDVTLSSAGVLPITGTLAQTLSALALSSAGTIAQPSITGDLGVTLDALTLTATNVSAAIAATTGGGPDVRLPKGAYDFLNAPRRRRDEEVEKVVKPLSPAQKRVVRKVAQDDDEHFIKRLHEQFDAHEWQWTQRTQAIAQQIAQVLQRHAQNEAEQAQQARVEAQQAQAAQQAAQQIQRRRRRNALLLALLH